MESVLARDTPKAVGLMVAHLQETYEATAKWLPQEDA
jgi:DNA-binding GntR family transcriptional regulator